MSTDVIRWGRGFRYSGSLCLSIGAGGIDGESTRVVAVRSPWTDADVRREYVWSSNVFGAKLCRLRISPLLICWFTFWSALLVAIVLPKSSSLQIECGTWDVEKSLFAISFDIAVDPLHLLASGFTISVGLTSPFLQAWAPFIAGAWVGAGVCDCPLRCFLSN